MTAAVQWRCRICRRIFPSQELAARHINEKHHHLVCGFPPKHEPLRLAA